MQSLDNQSKTMVDIKTLLPIELGIRLHGSVLPENWKNDFINSCINNLIIRLDVFSEKFTEEIEKDKSTVREKVKFSK